MRTAIKIIAITLGVVILLVAAAVVVLPRVINPNDYKAEIAAQVQKRTGRTLNIEGDIKLSVFPWLGLDLGEVQLGNAPGFGQKVFASAKQTQIRVKLLPLIFSRQIQMGKVVLDGLDLNLERNAQGRTNWADLTRQAQKPPAAQKPSAPAGAPSVTVLAVGGLDIRDATLRWDDAEANRHYAIRDLTLSTGALEPAQPVDIKLGFRFEGGKPQVSGHISAQASAEADLAAQRYRLHDLRVDGEVNGEGVSGKALPLHLSGDADADLAKGTLTLAGVELGAGDLNATTKLQVHGFPDKPQYEGTFSVASFNPRALLARFGQTPPATADPKALTLLQFAAELKGSAQRLDLEAMSLRVDDTTLTGSLAVTNPEAPAVRFDLPADAIDADRYLPPREAGGAPAAAATPGTAAAAAPLPVDTLRALNADGRLRLGRLKLSGLTVNKINITLAAKNGLIKASPIQADLYEGTYNGNVTVDARGQTPRISVDEKLSKVQAGPLLADLQGKDFLTGVADASAKLTAAGLAPDQFKRTLNGDLSFSFTNGAIKGINIGRVLRQVQATLKGQALSAQEEPVKTDFSELSGTVQVKDGIATNKDLSGKSPLLRIAGQGTANLVEETMDYRLTATLVATAEGEGGKGLRDLAGIPVPIRISGSWQEPRIRPDLEAVAKAKAKEALGKPAEKASKEVEKKLEEVEKNLGEGSSKPLKDLLKGLTQ
jgi:AsmA protein